MMEVLVLLLDVFVMVTFRNTASGIGAVGVRVSTMMSLRRYAPMHRATFFGKCTSALFKE